MAIITIPHTYPISLYAGGTVASSVPGVWPAALNGRPLMIDDSGERWTHQGIATLRAQADQSESPAEHSLNPEGLWRQAEESWHHGAGQIFHDRPGSDDFRFLSSKGIDPWAFYEFSLLSDTDRKYSSIGASQFLAAAGARLYKSDGATLSYTTDASVDAPVWVTVSSTSGNTITGLASDGYTVYIADGAGIYTTNTGTGAASSFNTTDATLVGYVKGRLMIANLNVVTNVTGAATQAAVATHPSSAFRWVGFAEGTNHIYMAGFAGDKSQIYKTTIEDDATALELATPAGELPDGEIVTAIGGYLGFILVGTTEGVRFCQPDANGNLQIGPLIETGSTVRCFEGQGRFVWFGWENYDSVSTGLGRLNLTAFPETIDTGARVPAYASDLMVTGQGSVLSIATFNDLRVFSVGGLGIYAETSTKVASGTITSGRITFGLPDDKTAISLDVRNAPLEGSYTTAISLNGGDFVQNGAESGPNDTGTEFPVENTTGEFFSVQMTLYRSADDLTVGPIIHRWTLKATQGANDGANEYLIVPFQLFERTMLPNGQEVHIDVKAERDAIKALRRSRRVVVFQEIDDSYRVQVENFQWIPAGLRWNEEGVFRTPDGTMITQMKRLS
jgi:hypothetical protein